MLQNERVVVTGLGAMTPLGVGLQKFRDGLKSGKSGIAMIELIDTSRHTTKFGGEVKGFNPENYIDSKEARRMDRVVQFAVVASDEAVRDSGLQINDSNRNRIGAMVGCGIGGLAYLGNASIAPRCWKKARIGFQSVSDSNDDPQYGEPATFRFVTGACGPNTDVGFGLRVFGARHRHRLTTPSGAARPTPLSRAAPKRRSPTARMAGFGNMRALSRRNDDPHARLSSRSICHARWLRHRRRFAGTG